MAREGVSVQGEPSSVQNRHSEAGANRQRSVFPLLLTICSVEHQLAWSPGHVISVFFVTVSSVLSLPHGQDLGP